MRDFQDCETVSTDPNIVVSDPGSRNNRSKFRLHNPKRASIRVVQVDGCVIKEGIRCDYLLLSRADKVMGALNRLKALFCRH